MIGGPGVFGQVLRQFVRANIAVSEFLTPSIVEDTHAYTRYHSEGAAILDRGPRRVIDIGAGREWPFATPAGTAVIGVDIDIAEMEHNPHLHEKIGADACRDLGVPDGSVDLVMARAVIEHLQDTPGMLAAAYRALADDGELIVTFASKHAPFAILNRMLPHRVSQWLVGHLVPSRSEHPLGFKAFYDQASAAEFTQALDNAGFDVEQRYASYFSSQYYRFFTPLFVVALAYDYLCHALGRRQLAAYLMFVAKKRPPVEASLGERLLG